MGDAIIRLTLRKYRKLLKLIKRLPPEESQEALRQLRADMKSNISVSESEGELLRGALDDKIRYLKIMTPKQPGDADNLEEVAYYVVRDGKVVRGTAAKHSRWEIFKTLIVMILLEFRLIQYFIYL